MFVTASDAVVLSQCREFCYIYKCFSDCLLNNTDSILDDNYMVPMSADFYDSNFLNLDTALDKDTKQRSLAEDFYNIFETLLLMHIHVDACKALGKDISQLYGNACLFELSDKLLYHALSITDMANKSAASRSVRHQDGYIKERIARHKIIQQDYDGARHLIANRQKGYEITTLLYCHMALNDKKSFKQDLAIAKGNNPNFETHAMRCISNHMRRVFNQYCSLDTKPDARYD